MNVNLMDPKLLMTLVAVVIVTVAVIVVLYVGKRRNSTADLRKKFGPEYDRAVREQGSERKAEAKLADRQERVEKLNIKAVGIRTVPLRRLPKRGRRRSG
jgi:hypothetical protein